VEGHKLDQRVRLTVDAVRGSVARARDVERTLRTIPGVLAVEIDPHTGSTLIDYDPHAGAHEVEAELVDPAAEVTALCPVQRAPRGTLTLSKFVETLVIVGLELALQRALGPFFWPRRC
jgi:hypothetical protein